MWLPEDLEDTPIIIFCKEPFRLTGEKKYFDFSRGRN